MAQEDIDGKGGKAPLYDPLAIIQPELARVRERNPDAVWPLLRRLAHEEALMSRGGRSHGAPNVLTVENGMVRMESLLDGTYWLKGRRQRSHVFIMLLLNQGREIMPVHVEKAGRTRPFILPPSPRPVSPQAGWDHPACDDDRLADAAEKCAMGDPACDDDWQAEVAEHGMPDVSQRSSRSMMDEVPAAFRDGIDGILRNDSGSLGDQDSRDSIDESLRQLARSAEEARLAGDSIVEDRLAAERRDLITHRDRYFSRTGRPRKLVDEGERNRIKRIAESVYRIFRELDVYVPKTAVLLRRDTNLSGPTVSFKPEPGCEWEVRLRPLRSGRKGA